MAEERDNWYKVDNASKVFLATFDRRDTRSMRLSCSLNEPVDAELLTFVGNYRIICYTIINKYIVYYILYNINTITITNKLFR